LLSFYDEVCGLLAARLLQSDFVIVGKVVLRGVTRDLADHFRPPSGKSSSTNPPDGLWHLGARKYDIIGTCVSIIPTNANASADQ
jgi:hypothetical protein